MVISFIQHQALEYNVEPKVLQRDIILQVNSLLMELVPPVNHSTLVQNAVDIGVGFADATYVYKEVTVRRKIGNSWKEKSTVDFGSAIRMVAGYTENFMGTNKYSEIGHNVSRMAMKTSRNGGEGEPMIYPSPAHESSVDISADNIVDKEYGGGIEASCNDFERIFEDHKEITYRYEFEHSTIGREYVSSDPVRNTQIMTLDLLKVELTRRTAIGATKLTMAFGGVNPLNLKLDVVEKKITDTCDILQRMDKAKPIPPARYPTVLSTDSAWTLIHETVGHGVEGEGILNGTSFLRDFKNQMVASLELNVIDDSQVPSAGWNEFDDEGMKTKGTLIIDNGELSQFIHSRRTAYLMEEQPTGNGRLSSYLSRLRSRQTNLIVEPGGWSEEEIIEYVGDGIYIGPITHAQVTLSSGEFVMIPEYGIRIRDGELAEPVFTQMVRGSSLETLSNIEAIGDKVQAYPTMCNKNGRQIAVGMISPIMMIRDLEVR